MEPKKPPPKPVSNQDWTQIYFYKSKPAKPNQPTSSKTFISSKSPDQREIERIERILERPPRIQKQRSEMNIRTREYEEPDYTIKTVGIAWAQKLVQARNNKGITQKELAMAIREKN